ncbi:SH3 domain-containing protein [Clostridium sp.]|uniref:SH3 domain-containing protein n=1 Tax=Clostridium sp. TaxID=1506 RepID=UPI002FDDBE7A
MLFYRKYWAGYKRASRIKASACMAAIMSISLLTGVPVCAQEKNVPAVESNSIQQEEVVEDMNFRALQQYGTITANGVRLRKTPGNNGTILRQLNKGDMVVFDSRYQMRDVDGLTWAAVSYNGIYGWVATKYIYGA